MRYVALAVDYDGTLATDGRVDRSTVAALARLRAAGRHLILVTGRRLPDLLALFPQVTLCDLVVAENGGVLYWPATGVQQPLAASPPTALIEALHERRISPLSIGEVIIATVEPHEAAALDVIHDLGLEYQVIFNKGHVMLLPPTINKGSGLEAALAELRISPHNLVAVGDAENDHALLGLAECAVAVANAVPMLKEQADLVTTGAAGRGVIEIVDRLLADDLASLAPRSPRCGIPLGTRANGEVEHLPVHGVNVLIAGSSGSGKSTIMIGLIERLTERQYQVCTIDPEGEYDPLNCAVVLGDWEQAPAVDAVTRLLAWPGNNAVVNLLAVRLAARPAFFAALAQSLSELRARSGHPHWIAVDEAHHMLPAWGDPSLSAARPPLRQTMLATVDPSHVDQSVLAAIDVVIVTGERPDEILRAYCQSIEEEAPALAAVDLPRGQALVWRRREATAPFVIDVMPPETMHHRHCRKYAYGQLDSRRSFYFRGPDGGEPLPASNLLQFAELTEQVDDDTWLYHLLRDDYARWFREVIRDDELAAEADRGAALLHAAIAQSRAVLRRAIQRRYTLPT